MHTVGFIKSIFNAGVANTWSGTTGTTLTLGAAGLGFSLVTGDTLLVNVVGAQATTAVTYTLTATNGIVTKLCNIYSNTTFTDCNQAVFTVTQTATIDTTLTIKSTDSSVHDNVVQIIQYRGVDYYNPADVTTTTATTTLNSDLANPPSITPVTPGAKIVALYGAGQNTLSTWTTPSDVTNFNQQAGKTNTRSAFGEKDWTSGAFDPAALTGGDSTKTRDVWSAATVALRPLGNRYGFWFLKHP